MHAACLIPFLCRSSFSRVSPATSQNALASSESMRASQAAHSPSRTTMRSARQLVRPDILATSLSGFGLSDTSTSRAVAQWFGLAPWTNSPSDLRRTPRRRQPHFSIQSRGVVSERASSLIADCGFIRQVRARATCSMSTRRQPIARSSSSSHSQTAERKAPEQVANADATSCCPPSFSHRRAPLTFRWLAPHPLSAAQVLPHRSHRLPVPARI